MSLKTVDIVIIGGGPAGYIAAIKSARLGASVVLIEEHEVGGTCLNRGCIPTKYYSQSAHLLNQLTQGASRGVVYDGSKIHFDMLKAKAGKQKSVRKLTAGVRSLLKGAKVELINQRARITKNGTVALVDGTIIEAKRIIVATGSRSARIPVQGIDSPLVLDSDAILDLESVPKRLAVIGSGVIGVEFASIFHSFGSEVSLIELKPRILSDSDTQLSQALASSFAKRGITMHVDTTVSSIQTNNTSATIILANGSSLEADTILLAVGRKADLSFLEDPSYIRSEGGRIVTDETGLTSKPHIYAAGDVTGKAFLAHAAYHMGECVAHNVCVDLGLLKEEHKRFSLDTVPSVVYSIPEVSSVGLSEEEAKLAYEVTSGTFPLAANGRALSAGEPEGFVKIVADKRYGQILGASCVGMNASEIINEAVLAMKNELTVYEVAEAIHAHPTISEAFKEAAAACADRCYHMP
ncbi:MAG: dihydrolipoyl dehydrogenase [Sphaerochaetaceae bacterium]